MTTAQCSYGRPPDMTQSEATAAQRTWAFHLVKSADSTDATGLTPVMTISKAGAAFAAVNGSTAITELTNGWYQVVHAAADLDTIGSLSFRVAVATADTLNCSCQVDALDRNIATVNPSTGGIDAGSFTAAALAAISVPLVTVSPATVLVTTATADPAISMVKAVDCTVNVTGTFGSGSAQVQTTEDPTVVTPTWTNSGSALTSNGSVVVTGPHNAVRVHWTGATSPSIAIVFTIRKPAGT
ncbi:MAG TPA: hypothetical protein VLN57_21140 [Xanthobacteraceae bacterium]|nr:hypothetical protein [Xanthobacteraceae bacterium]